MFQFHGRRPIQQRYPQVFRPNGVCALDFYFGPTLEPSAPGRVALALVLRYANVSYPVVIFIDFGSSFRRGFAFRQIKEAIFCSVSIIVIRITIVYYRVGVPFPIGPICLQSPRIVEIKSFF